MRKQNPNVNIRRLVTRFVADESGATAIEYALVAAIMALVVVTFKDIFELLANGFMQPTGDALAGI